MKSKFDIGDLVTYDVPGFDNIYRGVICEKKIEKLLPARLHSPVYSLRDVSKVRIVWLGLSPGWNWLEEHNIYLHILVKYASVCQKEKK